MNPSSSDSPDALTLLRTHSDDLAGYFRQLLNSYSHAPKRLMESIEYSLLAGGKRLRPALIIECFHACSGKADKKHLALASAAAMELIHTFSLVHDDLPAMDNDDLRRGRPTNHKVFGEAMAILAGDAMVTMAFELLARQDDNQITPALIRELASASGPQGMIGGQVLDIDGENKSLSLDELKHLHRLKTGALLTASCRLGALAAGATPSHLQAVTTFGEHLGLAFQIIDDILDVTSTPEQMGKATQKDAAQGKNTYPNLLGLEASQRQATQELQAALKSLDPLGPQAVGLKNLARFVVERNT